jgi:hypothetical protein
MSTPQDPHAFAKLWAEAWNRRDVEAVLAHFHDDALFTSPVAQQVGYPTGVIRGKAELRRYWVSALAKTPDLHFEVTRVFVGLDVLVIEFLNQQGAARSEILVFRDGLISEGRGTFAV